jgi:hypothetical protein
MRLNGVVEKGWGRELIWATNDKYCGKFLYFNKDSKFSMHFHKEKDETWYVLDGKFIVKYINTTNAQIEEKELVVGDLVVLKQGDGIVADGIFISGNGMLYYLLSLLFFHQHFGLHLKQP